ncbi:hypothetical protein R5N98_05940 [Tenacibaculum maritimum]|uniref:Probable lipoprotein n=2 Tax=Tenacibaculum maritimum TaxID=107401 RepID=A0A2H1E894_9FLAO|nr:hypothetical protein [Tenacibaculum maritimum]QCD61404.1 hypothetical protein B9C57_02075 [Tenacibaculum maritimum]CAA0159649.1 Probable lipoprotein precursor [Tenacibaculum maritimum]CAA0167280.1 Probable lipoprotein precursor [Tenacibaculum maritimum]SFZ80602.1 Probable lipoprotein precursor [Tenacibaculum maritimum NCIMB 2154]
MNKISLFTLFTILCLSGCNSNKHTIELTQLTTTYPIILYMNKEYNEVVRIKFPLKVQLTNNSYSSKTFASIQYKYLPYEKGIGNPLYIEKNNTLIRIKQATKKYLAPLEKKEYIIYTRHRMDTSKYIQQQFKPYIDMMMAKKTDTLTIGTINQFKQKHRKLLLSLTKQDRIYINIWKSKNDISIPVKW